MKRFLRGAVLIAFLLLAINGMPEEAKAQLSQTAMSQIAAIASDKAKRTPAQQKMDSQLIYV